MDAIAAVYELSESAVYVHCQLILLLLHPFDFCSRSAWVSWQQKGKPFWGGSGISWTICHLGVYINADLTMRHTCSRLFPVASPLCASCALSDARCRYQCFSYWSLHWFSATACWSTCRTVLSSVCNPSRTQQPGSFSIWGNLSTSPMRWSVSTGFAFLSRSSSR